MAEANRSDRWVVPAASGVLAVTLWRVALLAFNQTDLLPAEALAWLWAQDPSVAPSVLTGWAIAAATALGDTTLAIRLPATLCHAATAMILGGIAERLFGYRAALTTALVYATLPIVALGSLFLSPATLAAPFAAAALLFYLRLLGDGARWVAFLVGLCLALGCLGHPAAFLLVICAILAGAVFPDARPGRIAGLLITVAFTAVLLPLLLWQWWETGAPAIWDGAIGPDMLAMAGLLLGLGAAIGPALFTALLIAAIRWRDQPPLLQFLMIFVFPILGIGGLMAILGAGLSWAAAAVLAAAPAGVVWLSGKARIWWGLVWLLNGLATVMLPLATVIPDRLPGAKVALVPVSGGSEIGQIIVDIAADLKIGDILVEDDGLRAVLAWIARDSALAVRSDTKPQPGLGASDVLLVLPMGLNPPCPIEAMDLAEIAATGGAYAQRPQMLYLVPGLCFSLP